MQHHCTFISNRSSGNRIHRGFTLIELLVVLGIAALLALLAVPSMQNAIESGQRAGGMNSAMSMLASARAEAVTRQVPIAICPSVDQDTCSGNNWEQGWIMFIDDGTGGTANNGDREGTEEIIRVGTESGGAITIRSSNFADAGAIIFDEQGVTLERGTLMICDDAGAPNAAAVVLNVSGQARLATDDTVDAGCVGCVEQDDGTEASCP